MLRPALSPFDHPVGERSERTLWIVPIEELVGDALDGRRDDVFLVTKVGPAHASRREVAVACEQSLRRLRTEWIDLYLPCCTRWHFRARCNLA
jgi:diketogulonate reductase-like aldo/keto reductase